MSRGRKPKRGLYWGAKLKCNTCETVIKSPDVHDWVAGKCPHETGIWVDGGSEYFRGGYAEDVVFQLLDPGNYQSGQKFRF
jgi:hypothetical protein